MKKFNPKSLVERGAEILSVDAGELGEIRYGSLLIKDLMEIYPEGFTVERPDPTYEQTMCLGWKMLNKAYPDLTLEDVQSWLPEDLKKVFDVLFKEEDFRAKESSELSG